MTFPSQPRRPQAQKFLANDTNFQSLTSKSDFDSLEALTIPSHPVPLIKNMTFPLTHHIKPTQMLGKGGMCPKSHQAGHRRPTALILKWHRRQPSWLTKPFTLNLTISPLNLSTKPFC